MARKSLLELQREEELKKSGRNNAGKLYNMTAICEVCGMSMDYGYGETFVCKGCGNTQLTEFGKVRKYIEDNGPQNAQVISKETGVDENTIRGYLREGRIEIPDGSEVYIQCQKCGTDIRYGRYCPDCSLALSKSIGGLMVSSGERPKMKSSGGRMHTLNRK